MQSAYSIRHVLQTLCPSANKDESTWITFTSNNKIYDLMLLYYDHKETNALARPSSSEPPGSPIVGCTQFCAGFCQGSAYFGTQFNREVSQHRPGNLLYMPGQFFFLASWRLEVETRWHSSEKHQQNVVATLCSAARASYSHEIINTLLFSRCRHLRVFA